ncbi:MAG: Peptidase M10A and M12B matrixin and adamalysin [Parcubacteria group bacterium GW2011_GWB1_38_8]|nr:MAG: Peptidase M10A and M12B matrixin and adamalysin [Parcubacteria group bacterium GW2011_GWB1_38_8]
MKKIFALVSLLVVSLALPVSAAPKASFSLPAQALEVSQGVFSLGQAYDIASDKIVEGYAVVHKKGYARSSATRGPKAPKCYAVMADGAKWKTVENWEVFAGAGLGGAFLLDRLTHSINTWEIVATNPNILGVGSLGAGAIVDPFTLDNENQVSFGDLENGTIAVTVVWGIWGGPTFNRQIVAWDQIYNTDYSWTEDALLEPTKMDFWNIAIHELGHSMGLSDIYNSSCSEVTMYGYGTEGETKKRDLAPADVTGINLLY